jgi:hypothetical protein
VAPHIELISPNDGQHFTLAEELPGQAFAFDPDNANPSTCSTTPPGSDGEGIPVTPVPTSTATPAVEFYIDWWDGGGWEQVHYQAQNTVAYCAFTGTPVCLLHDLSTGQWPNTTPINTGLHRMKARVVRDDEGVASEWVSVDFYIDPLPTATPSLTPTATDTATPPTPSATPTTDICAGIGLTGFGTSGTEMTLQLFNNSVAMIMIDQIELTWNAPPDLTEIKVDGNLIWDTTEPSPVNIGSGWSGTTADRQIGVGSPRQLKFLFFAAADPDGYSLTVHFSNGCDATFNN